MITLEAIQHGKKVSSMSFTERSSKDGRELTGKEMREWKEKIKKQFDKVDFECYLD